MSSESGSPANNSGLVRPVSLAAVFCILLVGLILLFPGQKRLADLSSQRDTDYLSTAYLRLLLRTRPEDAGLRIALAHNLVKSGKLADALDVLGPALAEQSESGRRARMKALEIYFSIAKMGSTDTPDDNQAYAIVAMRIEDLREETTEKNDLMRLADISLGAGLPNAAAEIHQKLAALDPGHREGWLELAAAQYLAGGEPFRAALIYEEFAKQAADDPPVHRRFVMLAIDAYLAANAGREALTLAETSAPRLTDDLEFMRRAMVLALAQNDHAIAKQLGRQLSTLAREDGALLSQQIELEIASGDLPAAVLFAMALVNLDVDNIDNRVRLARIAEWAGEPGIALEQWVRLARNAPSGEAMDNALRLAVGRQDDGLWLELADRAIQARPLRQQELEVLAWIGARNREPMRLIGFLQAYAKRHALDMTLSEMLAKVQEQQGDVAGAVATLQRMSPLLISPGDSASRQAAVFARNGGPDEQWQVLHAARAHAVAGDAAYWQTYGDLAWDRDSKADSVLAYRTAWEGGASDARIAERLIQLYNSAGEPKLAIAVGKEAYRRMNAPRWLLLAMDSASQSSLWDDLRDLSSLAQKEESRFANLEMYWLLQAHIANHDGSRTQARTAYSHALALNPASLPTRLQVLWFEINGGEKQQLGVYLRQWQADAQSEQAYWVPYAVALMQLHRPEDALYWFDKQAAAKPDDFPWLLSYADALGKAGRPEAAQQLRHSVLPRLKLKLAAADKTPNPDEKLLLLSYASLVREFEGASASDRVLTNMLARGYNDIELYDALVASSLSQKKFDSARHWLREAKARHHILPAYQSLAVALQKKDRHEIRQILQQREKDLSVPDRISALRHLGHNKLALSLTERSLLEEQDQSEALRQHRDQLRLQLRRLVEAGYQKRNLSELDITRGEAAASLPFDNARSTVRVAHNVLRPQGGILAALGSRHENDISLMTEFSAGDDPMRFTLGTNQRNDKSLVYGRFEWTHLNAAQLSTRLDVSVNALTEETSALRAIGSKDKLAISFSGNLSDPMYARLELAAQRFHTRTDKTLGRGFRVEGEIGTTLLDSGPTWKVRVSGSAERNRLADRLPMELTGPPLNFPEPVESILARRFSTLGLGTTLQFGHSDGVARAAHGLIDGWVGRQWPTEDVAYSLRAAISVPVSGAGQVRLETFYTNVQGGLTVRGNSGVGIWYRHQF